MKYVTSDANKVSNTRSNKKLLTQEAIKEDVEPLPSQLSPPEKAKNLELNKVARSSRNTRPQSTFENQSNTCEVHE